MLKNQWIYSIFDQKIAQSSHFSASFFGLKIYDFSDFLSKIIQNTTFLMIFIENLYYIYIIDIIYRYTISIL